MGEEYGPVKTKAAKVFGMIVDVLFPSSIFYGPVACETRWFKLIKGDEKAQTSSAVALIILWLEKYGDDLNGQAEVLNAFRKGKSLGSFRISVERINDAED